MISFAISTGVNWKISNPMGFGEPKMPSPEEMMKVEQKLIDHELLTDREQLQGEENLTEIAEKFFYPNEIPERSKKILDNFRSGSLLAHTASLEQIDSLFDTFNRDKEIKNLSTSLITEGGKNALYGSRSIGLLFDGRKVILGHISKEDSSSNRQGDEFHASDHAKVESLEELAKHSRSSEMTSINEVNISFSSPKEILGIFGKNSVGGKLDAAIAYIKMGRKLPLYILKEKPMSQHEYPNASFIEKWEPTQSELLELIKKYPVARGRKKYEKILQYY